MLTVRDLMTSDVVSVSPELTLRGAIELFARRHISGAPVLVGERLIGVVSTSDLLSFESSAPEADEVAADITLWQSPDEWQEGDDAPGAFFGEWWDDTGADVAERMHHLGRDEADPLSEHEISEVMSRSVCAVHPDVSVVFAAGFMVRAGVHRLLAVEGRRLKGIITSLDIVRAVALRELVLD